VLFGCSDDADVRATDVTSHGLDGVSFRLRSKGESAMVRSKLPGRHMVSNALAAAAVGLVDGMSVREVAAALESAQVPLRMQMLPGRAGSTILDDTYNASPASMAAALDLLGEVPGRRIALLGDMAELGAAEREGHLAVGRRAAETADVIHAVGELGKLIAQAARKAGHGAVHHWPTKEAAAEAVAAELGKGDVVLLKASRAAAFETLLDVLKE
jgi:UDP-N-acetylmuramoyl-tripeptide--D-alanyl-D-alanine ligase